MNQDVDIVTLLILLGVAIVLTIIEHKYKRK